jgi:hypothetical protein
VTEQASSGTVADAAGDISTPGLDMLPGVPHDSTGHHGRPASWVAVSIIIVGFIVGGVAMVPEPRWWIFWVGAGIVVVGGIVAAAIRIFDDWY